MIREARNLNLFPYTEGNDELFIDSRRFFVALSKFQHVDCITYTYGYHPLMNVRRVLTNLLCCDKVFAKESCKELRQETNTHGKLYLCYDFDKLRQCFIGSLNLRKGINYNIMMAAPTKHNEVLQKYFDTIWKQAKKKVNFQQPDFTGVAYQGKI